MRQLKPLILLALIIFAVVWWQRQSTAPIIGTAPATTTSTTGATRADTDAAASASLPAEARNTLQRIARGGPFTHRQDGGVFGNYEGLLPQQPRGYYQEYTVETPGAGNRGARRIITGATPPTVYYYTDDHYRSFRPIRGTP